MTDQIPARALAFLSTPYTSHKGGLIEAHDQACRVAGLLMRAGIRLFCPIAHSHLIAFRGKIDPRDHEFWLNQNQPLLERCDALIVAHLDGWQESRGVLHEIAYFEKANKPIFDLPNSLDPSRMVKRKRAVIRERYEGKGPEEFTRDVNEYLQP